jgi:branched-subunit amino acid ABC-type transport system permease component
MVSGPIRRGLRPRRLVVGVVVGIAVASLASALLSHNAAGAFEIAAIAAFCVLVICYGASLLYVTRTEKGRAARAAHRRHRESRDA